MATTVTTTTITPADHHRHDHHHAADGHAAHVHGAQPHAAHVHGDMDIRGHERTFDVFVKFLVWNAVACAAILIFLALANA